MTVNNLLNIIGSYGARVALSLLRGVGSQGGKEILSIFSSSIIQKIFF